MKKPKRSRRQKTEIELISESIDVAGLRMRVALPNKFTANQLALYELRQARLRLTREIRAIERGDRN